MKKLSAVFLICIFALPLWGQVRISELVELTSPTGVDSIQFPVTCKSGATKYTRKFHWNDMITAIRDSCEVTTFDSLRMSLLRLGGQNVTLLVKDSIEYVTAWRRIADSDADGYINYAGLESDVRSAVFRDQLLLMTNTVTNASITEDYGGANNIRLSWTGKLLLYNPVTNKYEYLVDATSGAKNIDLNNSTATTAYIKMSEIDNNGSSLTVYYTTYNISATIGDPDIFILAQQNTGGNQEDVSGPLVDFLNRWLTIDLDDFRDVTDTDGDDKPQVLDPDLTHQNFGNGRALLNATSLSFTDAFDDSLITGMTTVSGTYTIPEVTFQGNTRRALRATGGNYTFDITGTYLPTDISGFVKNVSGANILLIYPEYGSGGTNAKVYETYLQIADSTGGGNTQTAIKTSTNEWYYFKLTVNNHDMILSLWSTDNDSNFYYMGEARRKDATQTLTTGKVRITLYSTNYLYDLRINGNTGFATKSGLLSDVSYSKDTRTDTLTALNGENIYNKDRAYFNNGLEGDGYQIGEGSICSFSNNFNAGEYKGIKAYAGSLDIIYENATHDSIMFVEGTLTPAKSPVFYINKGMKDNYYKLSFDSKLITDQEIFFVNLQGYIPSSSPRGYVCQNRISYFEYGVKQNETTYYQARRTYHLPAGDSTWTHHDFYVYDETVEWYIDSTLAYSGNLSALANHDSISYITIGSTYNTDFKIDNIVIADLPSTLASVQNSKRGSPVFIHGDATDYSINSKGGKNYFEKNIRAEDYITAKNLPLNLSCLDSVELANAGFTASTSFSAWMAGTNGIVKVPFWDYFPDKIGTIAFDVIPNIDLYDSVGTFRVLQIGSGTSNSSTRTNGMYIDLNTFRNESTSDYNMRFRGNVFFRYGYGNDYGTDSLGYNVEKMAPWIRDVAAMGIRYTGVVDTPAYFYIRDDSLVVWDQGADILRVSLSNASYNYSDEIADALAADDIDVRYLAYEKSINLMNTEDTVRFDVWPKFLERSSICQKKEFRLCFDGNTQEISLYIDGWEVNENDDEMVSEFSWGGYVTFGGKPDGTTRFPGQIKNIRLYPYFYRPPRPFIMAAHYLKEGDDTTHNASNVYLGDLSTTRYHRIMSYLDSLGFVNLKMKDLLDIWKGKEPPLNSYAFSLDDYSFRNYYNFRDDFQAEDTYPICAINYTALDSDTEWDSVKVTEDAGWDIISHSFAHDEHDTISYWLFNVNFDSTEARNLRYTHSVPRVFAWPGGASSQESCDALRFEGYEMGFDGTTYPFCRGIRKYNQPRYPVTSETQTFANVKAYIDKIYIDPKKIKMK